MKNFPKVALVTGAVGGIGKATVERFLQEGLKVVASDILPENEFLDNANVVFLPHDVSIAESWTSVLKKVRERFGRLDILVNNAGIGTLPDIEEEEDAGWQEMLDINGKSIWLGIKSVVPLMRTNNYGSIVNVSSIFGASGGFGKSTAYHASKGVVSAVTRNAAIRYAPENIRVNAVSPGFVKVAREEKTIEKVKRTALMWACIGGHVAPLGRNVVLRGETDPAYWYAGYGAHITVGGTSWDTR